VPVINEDGGGLGSADILLIVVLSVVGFVIISILIALFVRRYKKKQLRLRRKAPIATPAPVIAPNI
jgi:membrane protein implicated in regulation of membrane protease activity